nr:MAG TPA: hypothetical protein [Caudoviricetes sp.]
MFSQMICCNVFSFPSIFLYLLSRLFSKIFHLLQSSNK